MDGGFAIGLMVAGYIIMMFMAIYFVFVSAPRRANYKRFRVDALEKRGGRITVNGRTLEVKPGAQITVKPYSLIILQNGQEYCLSFNGWTSVVVEVNY